MLSIIFLERGMNNKLASITMKKDKMGPLDSKDTAK